MAMFQPGSSTETTSEGGTPALKRARPAPVVDVNLRAGPKLAQAREILGLTLDEISDRMHVRRDYLEALEAMNVKLLPGRAYALAYIRDYARLLGLDAPAIVEQFKKESAATREDSTPQLRNPESKPRPDRPWLLAVAIGLVAVGFLGWQAWRDSNVGDPRLETAAATRAAAPRATAPAATAPAPAPAQTTHAVVELTATAAAWLEVRGPDGTIFLSRDLKPGDRYRPDVGAGWTLHARDGGAFQVSIDGRPAGLLGEAGSPVLGRRVDLLAASPRPVPAHPEG